MFMVHIPLKLAMTRLYQCINDKHVTNHNDDEDVSYEPDDKDDSKHDRNKEQSEAPYHPLILLVHADAVIEGVVPQGGVVIL